MNTRRSGLLLLALGMLGTQAGHLLAYQVLFGAAAYQVQSMGVHGYFPILAKTGLGLLGAIVLAALLVVGLARIVSRRDLRRDPSGPSYLRLIAALYTIQLALFVVQETAEATFAGVPAGSIMTLLLWGTLGQLPVAAVAALALRWLAIRFEAAVEEIQELVGLVEPSPGVVPALPPAVIPTEADTLHSQIARSALHKRGPPYLLRSCSI